MKSNQLFFRVQQFYQLQDRRMAIASQIRAIETEMKEDKAKKSDILAETAVLKTHLDQFKTLEEDVGKTVEIEIKKNPMWKGYFKDVCGIGPMLGASLLVLIDINKAQHASSLWKYAGLDVADDGRGRGKYKDHLVDKEYKNAKGDIKKTKGITYNAMLKTVCWKIGEQFIKAKNGKYRKIYDTSKTFYQKKFPNEVPSELDKRTNYTKMHIHNMARRRTVKLFLADFWLTWREHEGLPTSEPFAHRGEASAEKKTISKERVKNKK